MNSKVSSSFCQLDEEIGAQELTMLVITKYLARRCKCIEVNALMIEGNKYMLNSLMLK